jgi:hypothetical protein
VRGQAKGTTLLIICAVCLFATAPTGADAQGDIPMLFALPVGSYIPHLSYSTSFAVERPVDNQPTQLGTFEQGLKLGFPIWQTKEDEVSFSGGFRAQLIDTGAVLPDTGEPFPRRLWDISFGPAYRHRFKNRWVLGISSLVGSASDEPFDQFDVLDINANLFLRIPSGERNAWIVLLNYASNREFLRHYPIPGFGFLLASKKNVRGFFGVPFFVQFYPKGPISFRASYIPIVKIDAVLSAMPSKSVELFAGYQWRNERYMRADRVDRDDRLYYYEMLAKAGVVLKPARWAKLTLEGGYSFRRKYFEGERFYDDSFNRVDVKPGPYASMDLKLMLGRPPEAR